MDFKSIPQHLAIKTRRSSYLIVSILLLLHLLPILIFKYFPTQDGFSHLYNAHVLKSYHNVENYQLRNVYDLRLTLFPNWTSHLLLALLMHIFPPLICEKILLIMCISLIPLSLFYFLHGVHPEATSSPGQNVFGLVGFIYAYNYLLHMGFYNFTLSISLFFFTLGYWCRHQWLQPPNNLGGKKLSLLYLLIAATYFTHYQSFALLLLAITFLTIFSSLYTVGRNGDNKSDDWWLGSKIKPILVFLGLMLPFYLLMLSYYLDRRESEGTYRSFEQLTNYFLSMKSLVAFRDDHILVGQILLAVFGIAFLFTVINRVQKIGQSVMGKAGGKLFWPQVLRPEDVFLLMALMLTAMYYKLPWANYGGGWINDRVHLYIFLVLLPFFDLGDYSSLRRKSSPNWPAYYRTILGGIIISLSLWHLRLNCQTYARLNEDLTNAMPAPGQLSAHTILASQPGEWNGWADALAQTPKYVEPFGHLECYLALENNVAYLDNYEATTDHFPIRFKNRDLPADYLLLWRTQYQQAADLESQYDLMAENSYNRLYQRKKAKPDALLWSKNQKTVSIQFDFGGGQVTSANQPEYPSIVVTTDSRYVDGGYGWVTETARYPFVKTVSRSEGHQQNQDQDGIWSLEASVFRVALPNGQYRVTSTFSSVEERPIRIELVANGEKKIEKLSIGSEAHTSRYQITVVDQRLTQLIYTSSLQKGWVWLACEIERIQWPTE